MELPATIIRALTASTARDDVRYYLAGIELAPHPTDPTRATLTASDGHALASYEFTPTDTISNPIIIEPPPPPRATAATIRLELHCTEAGTPLSATWREYTTTGKHVRATAANLIDATYPDWRSAIAPDPKLGRTDWHKNPPPQLAFNPELAARVTRALTTKAAGSPHVLFEFSDSPEAKACVSPIRLVIEREPDLLAVVMPCRQ